MPCSFCSLWYFIADATIPPAPENHTERSEDDEANETLQRRLTKLGPLRDAKQLRIKQKIRLQDVCGYYFGCEVSDEITSSKADLNIMIFFQQAQKKYLIQGSSGETLYVAKEDSSCLGRFCCANVRSLHLSVVDQTGSEVLDLRRPLNCTGCCCWFCYPRCTQKLALSSEGESIGK